MEARNSKVAAQPSNAGRANRFEDVSLENNKAFRLMVQLREMRVKVPNHRRRSMQTTMYRVLLTKFK